MLRIEAQEVTTRHLGSAWPWLCQPTTTEAGVVIGIDNLSGGVWRYDPWELYRTRVITSPSGLVLGQLGKGKSALVKTYLYRQATNGARQIFVLDPKGEYRLLADALGLAYIRLEPGGSVRLNPLDTGAVGVQASPHRRIAMIEALGAVSLERRLSPPERAGIAAVARGLSRSATLVDVVEALAAPGPATVAALRMKLAEARSALLNLTLGLGSLIDGSLAGMLDGASSVEIDWAGPGLVLDLSAVFGTPAMGPVMVCAGAWLSQAIAIPGPRRILLVDEAWAVLDRPEMAAWLQGVSKLARTYGVQLLVVTHRLTDFVAQAGSGSAAAEQALGLMADMETHIIYGQPEAERARAVSLLGLSEAEAEVVCGLPPHRALWRVGKRVAVVDHILGPDETALVWTDTAMAAQ